jgi:hypothetical protein
MVVGEANTGPGVEQKFFAELFYKKATACFRSTTRNVNLSHRPFHNRHGGLGYGHPQLPVLGNGSTESIYPQITQIYADDLNTLSA